MGARELPRVWIFNRQFYADDRLQEFRAVDNPHERIPYTDDAPGADQGGDAVTDEGEE